jgi:hypothetical protein
VHSHSAHRRGGTRLQVRVRDWLQAQQVRRSFCKSLIKVKVVQ